MSYKQCPFCGEKSIQRGYGLGVDLMTQDNRPWIGCPSCQCWIRGDSCVRRWNTRFYEKENAELRAQLAKCISALEAMLDVDVVEADKTYGTACI